MVLEYYSTSLNNARILKTGVPVKFAWKQGKRKMEWLGYVSSVSRKRGTEKNKPMKVLCVGASYPLKQRKTKTYKNKTVPEVAALIAKQNKLRFVGKNHARRFPQLAISGQSQWQWLHEHANKIGYAMYVQGTDLVFKPMDSLIKQFKKNSPRFEFWQDYIPKSAVIPDRTLDYVSILTGDNIEDDGPSRANKKSGGVNPITGKRFSASKSPNKTGKKLRKNVSQPLFDEFQSDQVAHDKPGAKEVAKAAAELARFNVNAMAGGTGDPRVHPYRVISVAGTGEDTDGYWLVRKVIHKISYSGFYDMELWVAIDGTGKNESEDKEPERTHVGVIDLTSLLNDYSSFNVEDGLVSVNLAVVLGDSGNGSSENSSESTSTSSLSVKAPILTGINNQGLLRTPSIWQTKVPANRSSTKTKKCRCKNGC